MTAVSRPPADLVGVATAGLLCGALAFVVAPLGVKGVIVGIVGSGLAAALAIVRDRKSLLLSCMVLSLVLLLHKSLGSFADDVHSGAPGLYISTLDVALAMLYLHWYVQGTLGVQALTAIRRPIMWAPLAALMATMVSILAAVDTGLGLAQCVRFLSMYALYFYVATHVRRRREIAVVLGSLAGGLVFLELVVVVLQWRTGGVLGLSFLGVPTQLGERTLDTGQLGRPFGTIIHPVFMGAVVGMLGLLALSLAIHLRPRRQRWLALAVAGMAVVPILLAQTRAAAVAFGVSGLLLGLGTLVTARLSRRAAVGAAVSAACALAICWPLARAQFADNFETSHFGYELDARNELNGVAVKMFYDRPVLGVGLNNFEQALPSYSEYGLIFDGNPVHNLFLLELSETGVVGLAAMLGLGMALTVAAARLARSRDPLHAGIGAGALAIVVFLVLEEQLGFSLRQEVPLAVFWIVFGLVVACSSIDRLAGVEMRRFATTNPVRCRVSA